MVQCLHLSKTCLSVSMESTGCENWGVLVWTGSKCGCCQAPAPLCGWYRRFPPFGISATSRCTARVLWCCPAQQRGAETERAAGAAGLGMVTYTQTGTAPAQGSHLPLAQSASKLDHVFTLFSDIQKMPRCAWCVHRQTHPSYLKVKEARSYTSAGLGFCANAALVHHYSSSVENGLEKLIIP